MTIKSFDIKSQKKQHMKNKINANAQFKHWENKPSTRQKRKQVEKDEKRKSKELENQQLNQSKKQKSKNIRKHIQKKVALHKNTSAVSINSSASNAVKLLINSKAVKNPALHPKIRRKFYRSRLPTGQISSQDQILVLLFLMLLISPAATTPTNHLQNNSHNNNKSRLQTNSNLLHSSFNSTQLSMINDSIPLVTNPFHSETLNSVPPINSIHDCHLLWSKIVNTSMKNNRETLCIRKLTAPNSNAYDTALALGIKMVSEGLPQNLDEYNKLLFAWPLKERVKLANDIFSASGIKSEIAKADSRNKDLNDFEKIRLDPHTQDRISIGESIREDATLELKVGEFTYLYHIIPDSPSLAYYELQQDLLSSLLTGDFNNFNQLFKLGVKLPRLSNNEILDKYGPIKKNEFSPVSQSLFSYMKNFFSSRSAMILKSPIEFIQHFYQLNHNLLTLVDYHDDFIMAAISGRKDILSMLMHTKPTQLNAALNTALLLILDLPGRSNIVLFLLQHGANLHELHGLGTWKRPLFCTITYHWLQKSCQNEYYQLILEYCADCIKKHQIDDQGTLLHILALKGDINTIRKLLVRDPSLRYVTDNKGRTPIQIIDKNTAPDLVALLSHRAQEENQHDLQSNSTNIFGNNITFDTLKIILSSVGVLAIAALIARYFQKSNADYHKQKKYIEQERSSLQSLTTDVITNQWSSHENKLKLNFPFNTAPQLLEKAGKIYERLHKFPQITLDNNHLKLTLLKILSATYGEHAISVTEDEIILTLEIDSHGNMPRFTPITTDFLNSIVHETAEYQELLIEDQLLIKKQDLNIDRTNLLKDIAQKYIQLQNEIDHINKMLNDLLNYKDEATKRLDSGNENLKKFAKSIVTRYQNIEKELQFVQKSFIAEKERYEEVQQRSSLGGYSTEHNNEDILVCNEYLTKINEELAKHQTSAIKVLSQLNSLSNHLIPLKEDVRKFERAKISYPDNSEHEIEMKQKTSLNLALSTKSGSAKEKDKSNLPSKPPALSEISLSSSTPSQLPLPKPSSQTITTTPELPATKLTIEIIPAKLQNISAVKPAATIRQTNDNEQFTSKIFTNKKPEQSSKLSAIELKNQINNYGEVISEMVSSIGKYNFSDNTERPLFKYALSYNLLRMFHCMWLEAMMDTERSSLENPNQIRLLRHMLAHVSNKTGENDLFMTACDIRSSFLRNLLNQANRSAHSQDIENISKEKIKNLSQQYQFNAAELYNTLKPRWDNHQSHILSAEDCLIEIRTALELIQNTIKSIKSAHEFSFQRDRVDAVKMLIVIIAEHQNILQREHPEIWKEMLQHDKDQLLEKCLTARNKICHYVDRIFPDVNCSDVFRIAINLGKYYPCPRKEQELSSDFVKR